MNEDRHPPAWFALSNGFYEEGELRAWSERLATEAIRILEDAGFEIVTAKKGKAMEALEATRKGTPEYRSGYDAGYKTALEVMRTFYD